MKFITITLSILLLNLAAEVTDRSTEQLLATIGNNHETPVPGVPFLLRTYDVRLRSVDRVVKRNSAILTADYRFSPSALIEWFNMLTQSLRGPLNVDHLYDGAGGSSRYDIQDNRGNNGYNYTSILTAKHLLGRIKVDYSSSLGFAHTNTERWITRIDDINIPAEHIDQNNILLGSYLLIGELEEMRSTIYKLKGNMKY